MPSSLAMITSTEDNYFIGIAPNLDGTLQLLEIEVTDTQMSFRTLVSDLLLMPHQEPKVFIYPEIFAINYHFGKLILCYFDVGGQAFTMSYDLFSQERSEAIKLSLAIRDNNTSQDENWDYKILCSNFRFKILSETAGKVYLVFTASRNLTDLDIVAIDYTQSQ